MHAVPLTMLRELQRQLDSDVLLNVGVEVNNWSARSLVGVNTVRELVLMRIMRDLDMAQFGFTDFHSSSQIGKQSTNIYTRDGTAEGLISAVKQRQTSPSKGERLTPKSWLQLFLTFVKSHQANR